MLGISVPPKAGRRATSRIKAMNMAERKERRRERKNICGRNETEQTRSALNTIAESLGIKHATRREILAALIEAGEHYYHPNSAHALETDMSCMVPCSKLTQSRE